MSDSKILVIMKIYKYINKVLLAGALCSSVAMVSCDDYLTLYPTDKITEEDFWNTETDLEGVRAGVYRQMASSSVTSRILYWGEIRSDNMSLYNMSQTNIQNVQQGILMPTNNMFDWSSLYTGINYCNLILEKGDEMTQPGAEVDPTFRQSSWKPIKAEMLAMRALYYFYLVRAYRDVPYVTTPCRTDEEALARTDSASLGVNVLGYLIKDLEDALPSSAVNFGSTTDNQCRITRRGIQSLLADLYLWRGCLLKNGNLKFRSDMSNPKLYVDGDTLTASTASSTYDAKAKADFKKAIEYSDLVIAYVDSVYQEKIKNSTGLDIRTDVKYPYLTRLNTFTSTDEIYAGLWGGNVSQSYDSNSEIIFNLVYDGENLTNDTPYTYTFNYSGTTGSVGYMSSNNSLSSSAKSSYDPERGFGKTDIRLLESLLYSSSSSSAPAIHKNVLSSLSITNFEDMTEQDLAGYANYANIHSQPWPIYRLTDVMLIKAEAIARSMSSDTKALSQVSANRNKEGYLLTEGFNLVNAIFERNNPKLVATGSEGASEAVSDRLKENYAYGTVTTGSETTAASDALTADDLITLVMNERQRENIAEGKRWFDIVRACEAAYNGSNSDALSKYITLSTTVRNRLKSLYALYSPVYSEEIKLYGIDYGGNLRQNPVWERYTVK